MRGSHQLLFIRDIYTEQWKFSTQSAAEADHQMKDEDSDITMCIGTCSLEVKITLIALVKSLTFSSSGNVFMIADKLTDRKSVRTTELDIRLR